jgi:hypothetical protein
MSFLDGLSLLVMGSRCTTGLKFVLAGPPAFDICEPGQVGNEAATAD